MLTDITISSIYWTGTHLKKAFFISLIQSLSYNKKNRNVVFCLRAAITLKKWRAMQYHFSFLHKCIFQCIEYALVHLLWIYYDCFVLGHFYVTFQFPTPISWTGKIYLANQGIGATKCLSEYNNLPLISIPVQQIIIYGNLLDFCVESSLLASLNLQ